MSVGAVGVLSIATEYPVLVIHVHGFDGYEPILGETDQPDHQKRRSENKK